MSTMNKLSSFSSIRQRSALRRVWPFGLLLACPGQVHPSGRQRHPPRNPAVASSGEEIVRYTVSFFSRYPSTLRGTWSGGCFQIDNGSGKRGVGDALENILIYERRPRGKQDVPPAILGIIM